VRAAALRASAQGDPRAEGDAAQRGEQREADRAGGAGVGQTGGPGHLGLVGGVARPIRGLALIGGGGIWLAGGVARAIAGSVA